MFYIFHNTQHGNTLILKNMKKMEFSNSDCNLTMLATETFDNILEQIRTSCLNFHMQISPFSAVISLKKSLIKDRSGKPCIPTEPSKSDSEHVEALVKKNHELERKLRVITDEHTKLKDNCAEASKTIEILKKDLETSDNEMREVKDAQILVKADLDNANKEILDQQKKIEVLNKKDLELEDMKKENIELERKVNSLFDTLYGCEECGYHGDFCKCDGESDETKEGYDDEAVPNLECVSVRPPTPTFSTMSTTSSHVLPPTPTTPPWTPPASSSSPSSRTPPGTPSQLRKKKGSVYGNMPAASSAHAQ